MPKATSAGGVIVKTENGKKKILLIIMEDGTGLSFPKGTAENGESLEDTAIREVTEETGLTDLSIVKKLGTVTRPAVENDGTRVEKDIHLYLMKTSNYTHGKSDECFDWYPVDEAIRKMGFPQEAKFLSEIESIL